LHLKKKDTATAIISRKSQLDKAINFRSKTVAVTIRGDETSLNMRLLPGWLDEYVLIVCSLATFFGAKFQ
jgi:hypothetical protein